MNITDQNFYKNLNQTTSLYSAVSSADALSKSAINKTAEGDKSDSANLQKGELAATLETSAKSSFAKNKGLLYRREQFVVPTHNNAQIDGTKIRPADHYSNMLRAETESKIDSDNATITDEQMDAFLRKAFQLFHCRDPFS